MNTGPRARAPTTKGRSPAGGGGGGGGGGARRGGVPGWGGECKGRQGWPVGGRGAPRDVFKFALVGRGGRGGGGVGGSGVARGVVVSRESTGLNACRFS